jgi:uncharacterized membrane protein
MPRKLTVDFLAERFGPGLVGLLSAIGVFWIPALWLLHATWHDLLLDKAMDVEVGLLAGLLAVVAFLPAIEEKTVIRKFKEWGYYRFLIGYLAEAIIIAAVASVLSLAIIVFPESWKFHYYVDRITSAIWWGCIVYSLATCYRIVKISLKTLLAK